MYANDLFLVWLDSVVLPLPFLLFSCEEKSSRGPPECVKSAVAAGCHWGGSSHGGRRPARWWKLSSEYSQLLSLLHHASKRVVFNHLVGSLDLSSGSNSSSSNTNTTSNGAPSKEYSEEEASNISDYEKLMLKFPPPQSKSSCTIC